MGDGSLVAPVEGGVGIRVAVAVTVGEAGRSAGVVAVTTSVGPAVLVGADAVGVAEVVVAVGRAVLVGADAVGAAEVVVVVVVVVGLWAVSSMPDESSVQAASKSSPAASDSSPTTRDGGTINGLLVMTGFLFIGIGSM